MNEKYNYLIKHCCTIPLNLQRIPMLFDIFVLTLFMCCFHERFSSISTPRNFVTFSLSVTMLSIFKKGSDSLKNLFFFEAGWNMEYFAFVKFSDNLFALNQWDILLRSQAFSEKQCLKAINWYRQQTLLDLVFLSIFKDHLRKLWREMAQGGSLGHTT